MISALERTCTGFKGHSNSDTISLHHRRRWPIFGEWNGRTMIKSLRHYAASPFVRPRAARWWCHLTSHETVRPSGESGEACCALVQNVRRWMRLAQTSSRADHPMANIPHRRTTIPIPRSAPLLNGPKAFRTNR